MGYFSNGTDGEIYFEQYCSKCVHESDGRQCPIWDMHMLWNYEGNKNADKKFALDMFIPRDEKGYNQKCKMFAYKPKMEKIISHSNDLEKLRRWNERLPLPTNPESK